jgi:hypothetical protein
MIFELYNAAAKMSKTIVWNFSIVEKYNKGLVETKKN